MAYVIRLWMEPILFFLMRIFTIPARLQLRFSTPSASWLTYDDLCTLNSHFRLVEKATLDQESEYQLKWAGRVSKVSDFYHSRTILEVGSGSGLAALAMLAAHRSISAVDIVDIRSDRLRDSQVSFSLGDVCDRLPYDDQMFDLVYSINSFEHFEDPGTALHEIIRVTRPGGVLFLAFSPLYYSPWGLHASRRLGMPYPQLLFPTSVIDQYVQQNKETIAHTYGEFADKTKIGPYLNEYSLSQYRQLIKLHHDHIKTFAYIESVSLDGLNIIYKYPGIISSKIPACDDLFISGIKLLAIKKHR